MPQQKPTRWYYKVYGLIKVKKTIRRFFTKKQNYGKANN